MPDGGQLIIETSKVSGPPDKPCRWISISIKDSGIGIPEEYLEKIFEPLFSTKRVGIGLGLALVKLLVEEQGGSIVVESQPGEGSMFTVRLPVTRDV